jgi:hypothetical protein
VLGQGLELCQLALAAGCMTREPEAHWLGWDKRFLFGTKRRRADATARSTSSGSGFAWAKIRGPNVEMFLIDS